jgi:hypothetical protein
MDWLRTNYKKILIVGGIILAVAVIFFASVFGYYLYQKRVNKDVMLVVGEEKITKQDYLTAFSDINGDFDPSNIENFDKMSDEDKGVVEEKLIENATLRQAAKAEGIRKDQTEIDKLLKEMDPDSMLDQYGQKNLVNRFESENLQKQILEKLVAKYAGQYLEVRFDRHFAISDALPEDRKTALKATQEADKKTDREYADKLSDELYKKLESKAITFQQAADLIENDKFIDYKNWDFTISSPVNSFNTADIEAGFELASEEGFSKALNETEKGQLAKPFLRKLDYGDWQKGEVNYIDAEWIILLLEDKKEG